MYYFSLTCLAKRAGCLKIVQQLWCLLHLYKKVIMCHLLFFLNLNKSKQVFHIRNLWLIQAWRLRKTKAESVQTTGLFAVVDFAQTVCTLLKKHTAGRVGKTQIQGGGDQRGSKQMHHGSGHLCLYRGREIHFLLLLVLHQFHWQFLPDVSVYPRSVWEASTGLMETYNQAHICPSHHLFCCFFFSGRATFSSFWQWKRKCCTEFPCKYSTFW